MNYQLFQQPYLEPNISPGRYLQPAGQESPAAAGEFSTSLSSQPLSDSEDEDELPTVPAAIESQSFEFQPPAPVKTINPTTLAETSNMTEASFNGFSWDKVVKANTADDSSVSQAMHQEDFHHQEQECQDEWHQEVPDPSFCSGKFSARSTSFGGMNNTREENFSDFSKIPSFQGSYVSQCSTNMEESIFRSGFIGQVS